MDHGDTCDEAYGPALAVLQKADQLQRQRKAEELVEELEVIKGRVDLAIESYEESTALEAESVNVAKMEFIEDLKQLEEHLLDATRRKRYLNEMTVFIVGYQKTCGNREQLLTQLYEFFMKNTGLFTFEEESQLESIDEVELEVVSERVNEALFCAEQATQRLAELNREIINYMSTSSSPKENKMKKEKVEKFLNQANEDIRRLSDKLMLAYTDLEANELKIKELLKQNELKNMEYLHFKSQLEISKNNLETVQQELKAHQLVSDHLSKQHVLQLEVLRSQIEDLRCQLHQAHLEKEQLNLHHSLIDQKQAANENQNGQQCTREGGEHSNIQQDDASQKVTDVTEKSLSEAKLYPNEDNERRDLTNTTGTELSEENQDLLDSNACSINSTPNKSYTVSDASSKESSHRELSTKGGSGTLPCTTESPPETTQEVFKDHNIDWKEEHTLERHSLLNQLQEGFKFQVTSTVGSVANLLSTSKEHFLTMQRSTAEMETSTSVEQESMQSMFVMESDSGDFGNSTDLDNYIDDRDRKLSPSPRRMFDDNLMCTKKQNESFSSPDVNDPESVNEVDAFLVSHEQTGLSVSSYSRCILQLKTCQQMYRTICQFRDTLVRLIQEKETMSGTAAFHDSAVVRHNADGDGHSQIHSMLSSTQHILNDALTVFSSLLATSDKECVRSSSECLSHERTTLDFNCIPEKGSQDTMVCSHTNIILESEAKVEIPDRTELQSKVQQLQDQLKEVVQKHEAQNDENKQKMAAMKYHLELLQKQNMFHQTKSVGHPVIELNHDAEKFPEMNSVVLFTRSDAQYNQRVLKRGLLMKQVSEEHYQNILQAMDDYINLQKLRFRQLVQQYLQHSAFNVAKKNICSLHDRDIPLLSEKLGSLYIKKRIKWGEESWRLAGERIKHVRSLMKKFESIEKESGLLLIKPVLLWSRSINSLQRAVKASRHPKVTSRLLLHVPVPSLAPSQAPFGFHRRHPSTKDMEKLKSRYKETTEDLNFHTDVPFISHLGSFQRLWRPEALSQLSFIPDGERHINTPKLLELDFTTMQIPQQHPCFRSQQQALMKGNREHVRKLRSYVTITNNPLSLKTLQNKITADQKIYRPFETPMPPTDLKNISTNSEPATPRPSPEEMFHSGKDLNIGSSYDLPSRSPQWLHNI